MAMGRVRAGQVEGISSKELFESVRDDVSRALGARAPARAIASR